MPYFSESAREHAPVVLRPRVGPRDDGAVVDAQVLVRHDESGSISSRLPSPSQRSQAPCGLLNEKVLGCISAMEAPQLVHVKVSEKSMDSPEPSPSTVSTSTSPRPASGLSPPSRSGGDLCPPDHEPVHHDLYVVFVVLVEFSSVGNSWSSPSTRTRA